MPASSFGAMPCACSTASSQLATTRVALSLGLPVMQVIPSEIGRLRRALPDMPISFSRLLPEAQLLLLRAGRLDAGLSPLRPKGSGELMGIPVYSSGMAVAFPGDRDGPGSRSKRPKDLEGRDFILIPRHLAPSRPKSAGLPHPGPGHGRLQGRPHPPPAVGGRYRRAPTSPAFPPRPSSRVCSESGESLPDPAAPQRNGPARPVRSADPAGGNAFPMAAQGPRGQPADGPEPDAASPAGLFASSIRRRWRRASAIMSSNRSSPFASSAAISRR